MPQIYTLKPTQNDSVLMNYMGNFYGTEHYYTNHFLSFKYTDGVKGFCEQAHAFWLLNLVESIVKAKPSMNEDLISITLLVNQDNTAFITFKDLTKTIYQQRIPYTDCPVGEWNFFYENNVFFWNGEY